MAFVNLNGEEVDAPVGRVPTHQLVKSPLGAAILDLVDELGYSPTDAAEVLGITVGELKRRYWATRDQMRTERHTAQYFDRIPNLIPRDMAALELVTRAGYSIGRAARVLGVNKGHLVRRVNITKEMLRCHLTPHTET